MNKAYKNSSDTGKFWSFKDTKNYKNIKKINENNNVIRTFIFDKNFLLEILLFDSEHKPKENSEYVVPIQYVSHNFPNGYYKALGGNNDLICFTDANILSVFKNEK